MSTRPAGIAPLRAVTATLGLSAAGALCGGLAGTIAFGIVVFLSDGFRLFTDPAVLQVATAAGAVIGSVAMPLIAWLLLRYVPLGRAFLGLSSGTILGGIIGWYGLAEHDVLMGPVGCAVLGFAAAGVLLRVGARRMRA